MSKEHYSSTKRKPAKRKTTTNGSNRTGNNGSRPKKTAPVVPVKSFFDRIGKFILLFIILGVIAAFLTLLTVNLAYYYGSNTEIGYGVYFNINVFITYMIGFVVTPIIIMYVTKKREEVMKANGHKKKKKEC